MNALPSLFPYPVVPRKRVSIGGACWPELGRGRACEAQVERSSSLLFISLALWAQSGLSWAAFAWLSSLAAPSDLPKTGVSAELLGNRSQGLLLYATKPTQASYPNCPSWLWIHAPRVSQVEVGPIGFASTYGYSRRRGYP